MAPPFATEGYIVSGERQTAVQFNLEIESFAVKLQLKLCKSVLRWKLVMCCVTLSCAVQIIVKGQEHFSRGKKTEGKDTQERGGVSRGCIKGSSSPPTT